MIWFAVRVGRCTRVVAESGMREVKQQGIVTFSSHGLIETALDIAIRFDRTIYDSIYVALAQRRSAQFITADEGLANAVAAHFPVKWLGSLCYAVDFQSTDCEDTRRKQPAFMSFCNQYLQVTATRMLNRRGRCLRFPARGGIQSTNC